jgi:hypothetical protein
MTVVSATTTLAHQFIANMDEHSLAGLLVTLLQKSEDLVKTELALVYATNQVAWQEKQVAKYKDMYETEHRLVRDLQGNPIPF